MEDFLTKVMSMDLTNERLPYSPIKLIKQDINFTFALQSPKGFQI